MAWIDRPTQLYPILKPDRPLIDIPQTRRAHQDPLRTPEDVPLREPWISTQSDDIYPLTPFDAERNDFPDVEDTNWAMGMVSPPSPSRRHSLDLLPDVYSSRYTGDADCAEWASGVASPHSPSRRNCVALPQDFEPASALHICDPPMLSPPSPSMHALAELPPDLGLHYPPDCFDCPQLSPPSPAYHNAVLPPLHFDVHTLFVRDAQLPAVAPSEEILLTASSPLQVEYHALLSLRERTVHVERTSRARNKAFRGRERELGRAVAELRATEASSNFAAAFDDAQSALHAVREAATRVMLERTEEKRRKKRAKERLKELRVLLGTGVDTLLSADEAPADPPGRFGTTGGLGLALHEPPSAEETRRVLAERKHVMRRLAASMTMRRRDLGMRSLLEAGNLVDDADKGSTIPPCRSSRLWNSAVAPDDTGE